MPKDNEETVIWKVSKYCQENRKEKHQGGCENNTALTVAKP